MTHPRSHITGKLGDVIDAEFRAAMDAQPCVTSCSLCGESFPGTVGEGRKWAADHRAKHHPDRKQKRRKTNNLNRWSHGQSDFQTEGLANAREVAAMLQRRNEDAA